MVGRTLESETAEKAHEVASAAGVGAPALRHHVQVVDHVEKGGARLVNRADDRSAPARQELEQAEALPRRHCVQAAVKLKKK